MHLIEQLLHIVHARGGGDVSPVEEGVDIRLGYAPPLRHFEQGKEMGDVAVDAAVGEQAPEVELLAVVARAVHGLDEGGIFEEVALLDRLGDLGEVLIDDAARADVEVPDLRVPHLPVGEPYGEPARAELGGGVGLSEFDDVFAAVHVDGIPYDEGVDAVAVHDDECIRFLIHTVRFLLCLEYLHIIQDIAAKCKC